MFDRGRRVVLATVAGAAVLGLMAEAAFAQTRFKAVTTFTVIADMARNVAGDAATVELITKPDAEIHNYQPTPGDILKAQEADLVLWNGLNLELWFERFFHRFKGCPRRRRLPGRQADGNRGGALQGQAEPACLDVAECGAHLRR